ncbi:hypothetical protein [Enterobacter roggenkampii]|uniref:hypothetical protein n=1 Tax=Enterobacter roggenkampii TaxID=1812935 RepID=UPI0035D3F417
MERAKELASLGGVILLVLGCVGWHIMQNDNAIYYAQKWHDAFEQEPTLSFEKADPNYKGEAGIYFSDCDKSSSKYLDCVYEHKQSLLKFSEHAKGTKDPKEYLQRWKKELLPKITNDYEADYPYIVYELKQAAFNAGVSPDVIADPTSYLMRFYRWLANDAYWIFFVGGGVGFIMCVPFLWLGFWRGVGIAVRSAKKEIIKK